MPILFLRVETLMVKQNTQIVTSRNKHSSQLQLPGKRGSLPSSKTLPFTAGRHHHRKPQVAKMQRTTVPGVPRLNGHIYNTAPAHKAQRTSQKRGQDDCKSQGIRKSVMRLCLLETTGMLHTCIAEPQILVQSLHGGSSFQAIKLGM